jgi:hypothetical protein
LGEIYEVQITKNIKLIQMSYQKQNGSSHHDPPGLDIAEVPHSLAEQEIAPDDKGKEDVAKDDDQEKDLNNGGILPIATTGVCLRADWDCKRIHINGDFTLEFVFFGCGCFFNVQH